MVVDIKSPTGYQANFLLLLNLSVAMWLSSSDVESTRHSQICGECSDKSNSLRNVERLCSRL